MITWYILKIILTPKKSLGFRLADFRADGSTELSILGSSHFSSLALLATWHTIHMMTILAEIHLFRMNFCNRIRIQNYFWIMFGIRYISTTKQIFDMNFLNIFLITVFHHNHPFVWGYVNEMYESRLNDQW